jgi:hypothetical protein
MPGPHEEFACRRQGCSLEKEPRCYVMVEWFRFNRAVSDGSGGFLNPRFWKSEGNTVELD